MSAQTGTRFVDFRSIRSGEVVEVSATGKYQISTTLLGSNATIDPAGYPGGGPRGYNFDNEPFHSAAHGTGLAIFGTGDAKEGLVVAPCATTVAKVGGRLVVGVNDKDPGNNAGELQFSIRVRPPTPEEWTTQRTGPCGAW